MSQFITRVELHGGVEANYENLHNRMAARGFSRQIVGDAGKTYDLPSAEYNYIGNATCQQVFERAKQAAEGTGRTFWILVSQVSDTVWFLRQRS